MGGLVAVSQGTAEEPQLIVLRYQGGGEETLGLVGKGVTFDSGGISIKPAAGMQEMKMDMSGASAVLETVAALAKLELPIDVLAVIPSTENMPSGTAIKPGDIITQFNGKTVEVNNTDAEGRLILADALAYAVELGADRIVDLATLTGAVLVALGSTYAALISNDDVFAEQVEEAAERTGELAWRLPLHAEYKDLTKGTVADLTNAAAKRKAGTIYAGSFLEEFVDGKPWVHLDIAGTAWDVGREYVGKGPTGYGVRLLDRPCALSLRRLGSALRRGYGGRRRERGRVVSVLGGLAIAIGLLWASAASAATLVGDYQFQGTRASAGPGPVLTDIGAGNAFQTDTVMGAQRQVLAFPLHPGCRWPRVSGTEAPPTPSSPPSASKTSAIHRPPTTAGSSIPPTRPRTQASTSTWGWPPTTATRSTQSTVPPSTSQTTSTRPLR